MVGVDRKSQTLKMNQKRAGLPILRVAFGLALLLTIPVAAQQPFPQFPTAGNGKYSQHDPGATGAIFADEAGADPKLARTLNAARQRALVDETDKLLKLARQLNQEIAESESSTLTDAQLRKLNEIGKLAKSVKEKMKFSVGGYPGLHYTAEPRDQ